MNRYAKAKLRADAAQHLFDAVTRAYRHREIGDAEYLAARKRHDAAQAEFDAAFRAVGGDGNREAKTMTDVFDTTQDTPLVEVARLIYNSPFPEQDRVLYLGRTLEWVDDWTDIEERLQLELDVLYDREGEMDQGRAEDQRIGYSDRYGN
jgi:hypothetical protein|tara:strand:- start:4724 stop:5173 length:450 start_codon:yes stop_codon:yes gene_type:complete